MGRSWKNDLLAAKNLELFKGAITKWNKEVYCNIFTRKRKLVAELKKV